MDASTAYNFLDLGGVTQWLHGECLVYQNLAAGYCDYEGLGGVYTVVAHISYWD